MVECLLDHCPWLSDGFLIELVTGLWVCGASAGIIVRRNPQIPFLRFLPRRTPSTDLMYYRMVMLGRLPVDIVRSYLKDTLIT
jgi:hypothetical protein